MYNTRPDRRPKRCETRSVNSMSAYQCRSIARQGFPRLEFGGRKYAAAAGRWRRVDATCAPRTSSRHSFVCVGGLGLSFQHIGTLHVLETPCSSAENEESKQGIVRLSLGQGKESSPARLYLQLGLASLSLHCPTQLISRPGCFFLGQRPQ